MAVSQSLPAGEVRYGRRPGEQGWEGPANCRTAHRPRCAPSGAPAGSRSGGPIVEHGDGPGRPSTASLGSQGTGGWETLYETPAEAARVRVVDDPRLDGIASASLASLDPLQGP